MYDVPVKIARATITVNIYVVNTTTYDLILGMNYLKKASATVDLNVEKMRIRYRGRRFEVPIDVQKGVCPKMIKEDDDSEEKSDEETFFVQTAQTIELPPKGVEIIDINIPSQYQGRIVPRRSLALAGLTIQGTTDYEGGMQGIITNRSNITSLTLRMGEHFAQLLPNLDQKTNQINAVVIHKEITTMEHTHEKQDKHAYKLRKKLSITEKAEIKRLMTQYEDILAVDFSELKLKPPKYFHDIDTGDTRLIKQAPYRMTHEKAKWVHEEQNRMHDAGIIEPSNSPWASPSIIISKKDRD